LVSLLVRRISAKLRAPRSQKPQDFAPMRASNQWLAMPSLEVNRDRIAELQWKSCMSMPKKLNAIGPQLQRLRSHQP
jgi:hypothetical protein